MSLARDIRPRTSRRLVSAAGLTCLLAFLTGTLAAPTGAATTWHVAPAGNDTTCSPCLTIQGAIDRASAGDTIAVTADQYTGGGTQVVDVTKSVTLSGGWDAGFTTQAGRTIVDAQHVIDHRGIVIEPGATATIERFDIRNGRTSASGGGIFNQGGTHLTLQDSVVWGNEAVNGGGIVNAGQLSILRSTISNNIASGGGGAVATLSGFSGSPVRVVESMIWANTATTGGGGVEIGSGTTLALVNSTVAGNSTAGRGGGVDIASPFPNATLVARSATIASNSAAEGGGIYAGDSGTVNLRNTLLAGNTAPSGPECRTTSLSSLASQGYNLFADTSGCMAGGVPTDLYNVDAHLSPPQDNGGPTQTMALLDASPAIDAADPVGCTDDTGAILMTDQRGLEREVSGRCDIGAFETQPPGNDDFADSDTLAPAGGTGGVDTTRASVESGEPEHAGDEGGSSVWFAWTPSFTDTAVIETSGSSFDTLVAVYTDPGGGLTHLVREAGNDDSTTVSQESRTCLAVTAGHTYFVAVDGYGGEQGATTLHWGPRAPGDTAPCAKLPPTVAGDPAVGQLLTITSDGIWFNAATAARRWTRCQAGLCRSIDGATGTTYRLTARDVGTSIRVDIREGSALSTSDPTAPVARTAAPAAGNGKVYFDSNRDDVHNHEIYALVPGADDATATRLTTSPLSDGEPSVSPDGTKLAFNHDGTIWVMNADGSGQVSTGVRGYSASWSPDASRIAYVFRNSNFNSYGSDAIGIMDTDGTNAVVLLQDLPDTFYDVAWSPDGSHIAFGFKQPGGHYHIGVIGADGRGPVTQLTNAALDDRSVAWSPDGTKLAFTRGSVSGTPPIGTLLTINADGTDEHVVYDGGTDLSKSVSEVTWSPDGTTLLFNFGCCDLYTVSSAGGPATLFASGGAQSGQHESPSWAVPVAAPPAPPAPPPPPSGGGGGGGGGGGSFPDLQVALTANATTPPPVGNELILQVTVSMKNLGNSSETTLELTLPGLTTTRLYIDRGTCEVKAPQILCNVAWITRDTSTHVTIWTTVAQAGDLELKAFVKAYPEPETEVANNTVTLTLANPPQGGGGSGGGAKTPPAQVLRGTSITGSALPGGTLRATRPTWNRAPQTVTFRWQLCRGTRCSVIPGATGLRLRILRAYAGRSVRLVVTASFDNATIKTVSRRVSIRRG